MKFDYSAGVEVVIGFNSGLVFLIDVLYLANFHFLSTDFYFLFLKDSYFFKI